MGSYRFTPRAGDDLFEIWSHIAQDNPEAADRVEEAVYPACERLTKLPLAGSVRKDLPPLPVRFWIVQPYVS